MAKKKKGKKPTTVLVAKSSVRDILRQTLKFLEVKDADFGHLVAACDDREVPVADAEAEPE